MVEEDIHLAFRVGHLPDLQIVARKMADLRMIHCAAPAYLERRGIPDPAVRSEPATIAWCSPTCQAVRNGASGGECEVGYAKSA